MDEKIRNAIWLRDRGICQNCKREVFEIVDPYESVLEELSTLKEIPIFKWSKKCWKCQKVTPIVSYNFVAGYNFHLGDIEKLDKILMEKYSFVNQAFSKTMGSKVVANTCIHCGSLQGNWFVMEDLIEITTEGKDMEKSIDLILPNILTVEDLSIEKEGLRPYKKRLSIGHVHHKDGNREHNDPDNLILLCRGCHVRIHSRPRKNR